MEEAGTGVREPESNTLSVRNPVVDAERMKPGEL